MSCPERVATALATLPWVESDTITADRKTRQAKFTITDKAAFDAEAIKATIGKAGYRKAQVLKGPTDG